MYYFGSGPAALPQEVLEEVSRNVIRHNNKELSILEIPHRGQVFQELIRESEVIVKSLLCLNDDFEICWMHGGGRAQFALVPMNFLGKDDTAGFIDSGHWAQQAQNYAAFYGKVRTLASSREENYSRLPEWPMEISKELAYLYLTTNNTIFGTQFQEIPKTEVPLIADMTSELFSRKLDYNRFSLIFAAAQKNIGPAGITLVIARKDFLEKQKKELPGIFSYRELFQKHSTYNTPPVLALYCCVLYLRWTARMGMDIIEERNREKAEMLYRAIDESAFFSGTVAKESRSHMNVCFRAKSQEQEEAFIDYARKADIRGIRGHRLTGGFRAALYNAISPEEVNYLIDVMKRFEQEF